VAFAQAIMATVKKYGLDGIDFECACFLSFESRSLAHYLVISWEFPGSQSVGCKSVASWEDTGNFLLFLQTLRAQKGAKHLILSAAVTIVPWTGSDGQPSRDVSGFGKVLDYIGSSLVSPYPNLERRFLT
jgi:chitinase